MVTGKVIDGEKKPKTKKDLKLAMGRQEGTGRNAPKTKKKRSKKKEKRSLLSVRSGKTLIRSRGKSREKKGHRGPLIE